MDKQITFKPLYHRGEENIAILFENYPSLNAIIKTIPGAKWTQRNRCWYVPMNEESYLFARRVLKGHGTIEITELRGYLEKRKQRVRLTFTRQEPRSGGNKNLTGQKEP